MVRLLRLGVKVALVVVGAVALYLGVTFFQVWQASRNDHVHPAQAIIVLGAAQYDGTPSPVLRARLDHAIDLFQRKVAPVVAVTGGRQPGDRATEASAAAGYLIGRGIPESSLRLETAGLNSWQSLASTARFLQQEGIEEVVLVSSPYHAFRTERIAHEVGLKGHASPAPDSAEGGPTELVRMGRETVAVAVGRIIGHRRLVDLDERVTRVRTEVRDR
ncbi:MAG TPA: YdcF family protein [Acidimicrobiales bacterium]|nr:YdcF family protein [Acidimicrobiales bacterium]